MAVQNPGSVFPFKLVGTVTQNQGVVDSLGIQLVSRGGANLTSNINTSAAVIKASAGRVGKVFVNTAGSAAGSISNVATTGGVAASNLLFNIPNTAGVYDIDAPCSAGIVVTPGSGQVLAISWT